MKVSYDAERDTVTVVFRDVPVAESDESKPGVVLDYDSAGDIVSIEVLDASQRVEELDKVTRANRFVNRAGVPTCLRPSGLAEDGYPRHEMGILEMPREGQGPPRRPHPACCP
jgi:uncharacterized protein YuzE